MITLTGTIAEVTNGKAGIDKESGEVIDAVPTMYVQHRTNSDPSSDLVIEKIKLKDPATFAACRAAVGKLMRIDVRTWSQGGKSGFWIEAGVLPTVIQASIQAPSPLKAAA